MAYSYESYPNQARKSPFFKNTRIMHALTPFLSLSTDASNRLRTRIGELRTLAGLSQEKMAARIGIAEGRYSHYERGIRRFPVDLLPKIAEALGVTEAELFGVAPTRAKRGPLSEWEKRVEVIKTLPVDKQRALQQVVDAFLAATAKSAA